MSNYHYTGKESGAGNLGTALLPCFSFPSFSLPCFMFLFFSFKTLWEWKIFNHTTLGVCFSGFLSRLFYSSMLPRARWCGAAAEAKAALMNGLGR